MSKNSNKQLLVDFFNDVEKLKNAAKIDLKIELYFTKGTDGGADIDIANFICIWSVTRKCLIEIKIDIENLSVINFNFHSQKERIPGYSALATMLFTESQNKGLYKVLCENLRK